MLSRLGRRNGFTLIETIVSLTILVIVFTQLFLTASGGARNESRSDFLLHALRQAENKLAILGIENTIMTGMSEGRFDDGLLWSLNVELKGAVSRPFDELTVFNIYTAVLNVSRPTGYSDKLSLSTVKVIQSQKGIK
jgi:prepilin-type N-terminal cleavage/methylation domain-containing protein